MSHAGHTVSTGPAGATGDRPGFLAELWDSISVRTVELMIGILLLETGFILSFVGAFHSPAPHRIPISVVAPAQVSGPLVSTLNTIPSARCGPPRAPARLRPAARSGTIPSARLWREPMAIATPRYAVNATCLPHNNVWQDIEAISGTGGHAVGLLERKFTDGADPRIDRFGRRGGVSPPTAVQPNASVATASTATKPP